jgi:hypothetical protein
MRTLGTTRLQALALAGLCAHGLWHTGFGVARAEPAASILVIAGRGVSVSLRSDVRETLAELADLVDPRDYAIAARKAHLSADSDQALDSIAPKLGARLIVLLSVQHRVLAVNYRSSVTGGALHTARVTARRGRLDGSARAQLKEEISRALTQAAAEPERRLDRPAPSVIAAAPEAEPALVPEPTGAALEEPVQPAVDAAASSSDEPATAQAARIEPEPEPAPMRALRAWLGVGTGIGQRSVRLPTRSGERQLDAGPFPALEVLLRVDAALGSSWRLGAAAHYQTSVAEVIASTPAAGVEKQTSLRTHHVEVGLTPGLRFGTSDASVSLRLFAGWAWRGLRSVANIDIPRYTLDGVVLRPEFSIPLGTDRVILSLAPELLAIVDMTPELRQVGATSHTGLAWAGEAALAVKASRLVGIGLRYRESRATVHSAWSTAMTDNERFVTVQWLLQY